MGQVEQRTRLARLLVAPPPVVYEELKSYSADVQTSPYTAASEELEASLAARNDPLIDLAIASFGASHETIGELYRKGKSPAVDGTDAQYRQGLRLAVLANETIDSKGFLSRFPYTLYDMAADAIGLLDVLSIDRVHVVGRSVGGMVAQIMAGEHSERVLSLTSIMSSTGNPELPQAAPDIMAMMTRPAPNPFSDEPGFLAHSLAFARRISESEYPLDGEVHRRLVLEEIQRPL